MKTLSASQISTFQSCARAWSFAYIDGKRPPGTKATQLGQSIHSEMENWLKHSTPPTSPQARALMAHAPAPGIADVEHAINLQTPNSLWRGFADLLHDLNEDGSAAKAFTTGHTLLGDWKTSSSLSWAKSAEYLAEEDTQAALYAAYAFSKGAERVSGRWVYATTKGAVKVHPVNFTFTRDVVQKNVDALDCVAKEVQKLYTLRKKTNELTPNFAHCESYGGCAHKSYCDRSPVQGAISMSDPGSFADYINKAFPSQVVPPPPAPTMAVPPPPSFVPAPPPPPMPARPLTEESDDTRTHDFLAQTIGAKAADRIIGQVKKESVIPPPPPVHPAFVNVDLKAPMTKAQMEALFEEEGRPQVGAIGVINSPESPLYAPASPEESQILVPVINTSATPTPDVLDTMDRGTLKALNIRLGLCTDSSRFQEPKLRANIREYAQTHGIAVEDLVAGPSVDSSEPSVDVSSPGEQLEANRPDGKLYPVGIMTAEDDANRRAVAAQRAVDVGLTSEEREAVSAAIVEAKLTETDHFAAIRDIVRSELERFFSERFGK